MGGRDKVIDMRRQYKQRAGAKNRKNNKTARALGVVILLIALFFISFWVTSLVLQFNQRPNIPKQENLAETTTKPTYEQLEKLVMEKDEKIKNLEAELERYRNGSSIDQPLSSATQQPAEKPAETPASTKTPTSAPATAPTQTPAETPASTQAPTEAPTETPAPTEAPTGEAGVAE